MFLIVLWIFILRKSQLCESVGTWFCSWLCVQCLSNWLLKKYGMNVCKAPNYYLYLSLADTAIGNVFFFSVFSINECICLTNIKSKSIKNIINMLPVLLNLCGLTLCVFQLGRCQFTIHPWGEELFSSVAGRGYRVDAGSFHMLTIMRLFVHWWEWTSREKKEMATFISKIIERLQKDRWRAGHSKCGPRTNSIGINWVLIGNAESQVPP